MNTEERAIDEKSAAQHAAETGIPYADTREIELTSLSTLIKLENLRAYMVAPLHAYNAEALELGITDQTNRSKLPELQEKVGEIKLTFKTISHIGYNSILSHLYYDMFKEEREGNFKLFSTKLAASTPKQAFQYIAQLAYWLGASDIHIEPQANEARIRFRLDGVLHLISNVNTESYKIFLSDLQTRAEIKWGSSEAQSGRISYNLMNNDTSVAPVNMRIETIPTFHGEEIVVRIFNDETRNLDMEELGFSEAQLKRLNAITSHPNGMVMTVGPTGSGKTSTLYSLINKLNTTDTKIVTLEDPVEYEVPGISQIPVHTEDAEMFAGTLRAVMREDPNVIMIGEIRDIDTAKTALQAALTGHLVLSTFHATNSSAAVMRMLDMIGKNPLFASAIRMIIAQRLARKICTHCTQDIAPTTEQLDFIKAGIAAIPAERRPILADKVVLKHGTGCIECHGLGYKGRIAIIEMMTVTQDLEKMMISSDDTTAQLLEVQAVRNGMVTLLEDGIRKALDGVTTITEIISLTEEVPTSSV